MFFGVFFVFWLALAIMVGVAANARRRSGGGWFVLAMLVSPLIALLFLIAFPMRATAASPAPVSGPAPKHLEIKTSTRTAVIAAVVGLIVALAFSYVSRFGF
jgi:hypothetical protein